MGSAATYAGRENKTASTKGTGRINIHLSSSWHEKTKRPVSVLINIWKMSILDNEVILSLKKVIFR